MGFPINKGPGWNTSQYTAAAAGFFAGASASQVLLYYHLVPRNFAIVVVVAGLGVPPFIVGWWQKRKHGPFYNEPKEPL
ncbi:hypothetical protein JQ616_15580 [Bradyrhizobium tropiciagri]|uniref:hypothetical protein n=1 Tax=Bradyrhizobium tropiciagri TaxID=312253 RepID=UPI001BA7EF48|nr:hypothetical protein [Bradyrhizobium tropiciagri]MBR0896380.1 hypothetical protein [Bradyrhizobium tropiciagri]